ncbi:S-layer homology domain-containing protein [Paenibacillus sp. ACRRX]|uniref:S-layer homology domain-containing protein n=1 Tax=Paenibacillus sp. ACRRX TaxID=2918206 RepID=UPI001EF6F72B|nr:S-layer homology domain-containing protein [Paenibacillus sp. ACRRX]MCG7410153.1 S-layer homology domain-containing protein [Paenibacillus sp. ACRRX]
MLRSKQQRTLRHRLILWSSLTALLWQAVSLPVMAAGEVEPAAADQQVISQADRGFVQGNNVTSTSLDAGVLSTGNVQQPNGQAAQQQGGQQPAALPNMALTGLGPSLLITEMIPDTTNIGGSDGYEFIEVYNNSGHMLNTKDYKLVYRYLDSGDADLKYSLPDRVIQPGESFVIWSKNTDNLNEPVDRFKQFYKLNVDDRLIIELKWGGMSNSKPRALLLTDSQDTNVVRPIVTAAYDVSDVKADQGIHYVAPSTGSSMIKQGLSSASPLTVRPDQLTVVEPIQIMHAPPAQVVKGSNVPITAIVKGGQIGRMQFIEYKTDKMTKSLKLAMNSVTDVVYGAEIPASDLKDAALLQYTFEATDGRQQAKSQSFVVPVMDTAVGMPAYVPELLVTELVPNSANVGGADGYEFIELYNPTDKPVDMKDYTIRYRYPDEGAEADLWWRHTVPVTIPAGQTAVFWIINAENGSKTAVDFNANYGSNLTEGVNLFRLFNNGMANGSYRAISISTNTGVDRSVATYNDTTPAVDGTLENGAVIYQYNELTFPNMKKVSAAIEKGTPGTLLPYQKLPQLFHVPVDTVPPQVKLREIPAIAEDTKDLKLVFDAVDNTDVKTLKLYYRTDATKPFEERNIHLVNAAKELSYTLAASELMGHAALELYAEASDGTQTIRLSDIRIPIQSSQQQGVRFNVKEGQFIRGDKWIKAASGNERTDTLQVSIDGKPIAGNTLQPAMEQKVLFSFDVNKTNIFFQNGVVFQNEIIHVFDDSINGWTTLTVPIDADKLSYGNAVPITIRAGSKAGTFDESDNLDDFNIRNIRLVLADGTIIRDANYKDSTKEWDIGDSTGMKKQHDFQFAIPDKKYNGLGYTWKTTTIADGKHTLKAVESNGDSREINVVVDNTAPELKLNVTPQQVVKGKLTVQAEAADALSGIESVTAVLDDKPVQLPLELSSVLLPPGKHQLIVKAVDRAGNVTERASELRVQAELPDIPKLVSSLIHSLRTNGTLTVEVKDPTNDPLNVKFYEGFTFTPTDTSTMKVYQAASDVEPPLLAKLPNEQQLTAQQLQALAKLDNQSVRHDSWNQFPYQRYELSVDSRVKPTDELSVEWKGKSLPGRKVTMYAWNVQAGKWDALTTAVAGTDLFSLTGQAVVDAYINKERKVSVIVQDEVAPAADAASVKDFTLVWMSDTQYYAESYPHIYKSEVDWIAANKDKKNIRYVFHTGDVVDEMDKVEQWERADTYMKVLEQAEVPYGVLAGNHDVNHKDENYTDFSKYFGEKRFKDKPFYGESYKDNRGHYDLISVDGIDFIMVYMGWGIYENEIKWMNEVLAQYPDRQAILNFHEYLLVSGERGPIANKIYDQVVKKNANVIGVLSGHYHDAETKIDAIDDNGDGKPDRKVYQMLADYQGGPEGGEGYMRLLEFKASPDGKRIERIDMKTYSPYKDKFNYYDPKDHPGKDEFAIDWNIEPKLKRVETDMIRADIYSKHLIGAVDNVVSGGKASVTWDGLSDNGKYAWYAVAADAFGGTARSPVWLLGQTEDNGSGSNGNGGSVSGNNGGKDKPSIPDGDFVISAPAVLDASGVWGLSPNTTTIVLDGLKSHPKQSVTIEMKPNQALAADWKAALNREIMREAVKQESTLRLKLGTYTVTLPLAVVRNLPEGADKLVITGQSAFTRQQLAAYAKSWAASGLTWTGQALRVSLAVDIKGKTESIPASVQGITVNLAAKPQQGTWYVQPAGANTKAVKADTTDAGVQVALTEGNVMLAALMPKPAFTDVSGHWGQAYIEVSSALGLVNGQTETQFKPNAAVTRAEFASMIVRMLERVYGTASLVKAGSHSAASFQDVATGAWYAEAVSAAASMNIVKGDGKQFRPNDRVTREEAIVMLMRAIKLAGHDAGASALTFADKAAVATWAQPALQGAQSLQLVQGREGNRFMPQGAMTRAEVTKLLMQWLNL